MRILFSCALAIVAFCSCLSQAHSQDRPPGGGGENTGGNGRDVGALGGAAQADFQTLMDLIERTIDPDGWQNAGGNNTMIPYPSGVFVDPKGQLKRVASSTLDRSVEKRLRDASSDKPTGNKAWQNSSDLRMVSLKRLDKALVDASKGGNPLGAEAIRLAGINQISYVLVDAANEDVIIAGTADPDRMGYFLEDLAIVCALVNKQTAPLGCSIEPKQDRLLAIKNFLAKPDAGSMLSKSPKRFAEQLAELMGDQDVQVFGMNPRCGTAVALVAADEHMKQMGFGKAKLPVKLKTYFDHMDSKNQVSSESMIRWWFAYTDKPITTNESKTLFKLPSDCVCVLSEQQFVTQNGRQPTGNKDLAADAFASEMTAKMNELRNLEQNYSRLCCVFETALALQLALDSTSMADLGPWFPNLVGLGKMDQRKVVEPKSVAGLVTTQTLKKQKVHVAVISGGVTISPTQAAQKSNWEVSSVLNGSAVPNAAKAPESKAWWWD